MSYVYATCKTCGGKIQREGAVTDSRWSHVNDATRDQVKAHMSATGNDVKPK